MGNLIGGGVVNTAHISAANASAVNTSDAVAVVNPLGTVYAANSGGAVRVSGAQIKVAIDNSGTILNLPAPVGFTPNPENANPFATDANGNFSFALGANQLGTSRNAAHYYVLVSAANYRSRIIEILIQPNGANGFFTANVHALDNQAVAIANGFALTNETVELQNLAALVFNIPLFETSTIEINKSADKQTAEIGDIISYRIQVKNATASMISNAVVRDRLPESFIYASGTAEIQTGANPKKIRQSKKILSTNRAAENSTRSRSAIWRKAPTTTISRRRFSLFTWKRPTAVWEIWKARQNPATANRSRASLTPCAATRSPSARRASPKSPRASSRRARKTTSKK